MTKGNFIALADDIREHNRVAKNNDAHTPFTQDQIEALADFCKRQSSKFKRERWMLYVAGECGPNGGTK